MCVLFASATYLCLHSVKVNVLVPSILVIFTAATYLCSCYSSLLQPHIVVVREGKGPFPQIFTISCRFVLSEVVCQTKYYCSLKVKALVSPKFCSGYATAATYLCSVLAFIWVFLVSAMCA